MADRYDPKVTVRPAADRKGPETHQGPAQNDDPLFELARIVSGRGGAGAAAPAASATARRPAPSPEPPKPAPAAEPDVLADLEAELLSDLQASFSAMKEAIEPTRPEPPAEPEEPPVAAAPPPPPPEPERPAEPAPSEERPTAAASGHPHAEQHPSSEPPAAPPPQPAPRAPSAASRLAAVLRPPLQPVPHQPSPTPAPPAARERTPAPPPAPPASQVPAAPKKVDAGMFNLRPTTAPQVRVTPAPPAAGVSPPPSSPPDNPAPVAARPSRWEKPAEPPKPQTGGASRFAPPRAANQSHPAPGHPAAPPIAIDEEDLPFGEGAPFAHDGDDLGEEFPLDDFDMVPGYGDDTEVPPYPEDDELEPLRRRGVPRAMVAVAGILALVLIGVLGFVMLRPGAGGSGEPPIIAADATPTKISPPETPSTGNNGEQNKLIYDRVDSGSAEGPTDSNLVTPGNQQIADVPKSDDSSNPIARVIAPGGPAPEAPGTGAADGNTGDNGADLAMNEGDGSQSIGPRKVRTVVVRPDGTIVSSDAVAADGQQDAAASGDPGGATAAPTAETPQVPARPTDDDTAAIAGGKSGQELAITSNPDASASPAEETPAPAAAAEKPTPAATPKPKPAQPKAAASGSDTPIDLTRGNGNGNTQVAARSSGGQGALPLATSGMMVQVSSQRSQDAAQATFRDLQARYPNILGGYNGDIQRADLGDRGVYYRVRVGPFAASDAQDLCSALKGAGGDCILARR